MKKVIVLNKKEGETPLEALENFRKKNSVYVGTSMTYAGRLDPLASGVLIVLVDDEIKNKERYLALPKEYSFEVLFGFDTDTYDILGILNDSPHRQDLCGKINLRHGVDVEEFKNEIKKNIKSFIGEITQKYPIYSSKTVDGKPLFSYARSGEDVEIPVRKIFIKKLKLEKIREIDNKKLFKNIEKRIQKVKGDFRQDKILEKWRKELLFSIKNGNKFFIASLKIKCSSGTYVRGISNSLGEVMGIPALAFSIKRTKIGKYMIPRSRF